MLDTFERCGAETSVSTDRRSWTLLARVAADRGSDAGPARVRRWERRGTLGEAEAGRGPRRAPAVRRPVEAWRLPDRAFRPSPERRSSASPT